MTKPSPTCRSCGHVPLSPILSLGETPLANALLSRAQLATTEPRFPLDLAFCPECTLVQITQSVPPEMMFREYMYFSSFSDTMLEHARTIAERMIAERKLGPGSLVIEIASNDGYLLKNYLQHGVPVLGVEPASNIAKVAREQHGIDTIEEFFGTEIARSLATEGRQADVLHANNVLAHVPDLNGFIGGIATVLKLNGIAVIEVPFLLDMFDKLEFDTIYHEHLCYFSLTALDALFRRHGLSVVDVERHKIHGGSLRLFAAKAASGQAASPAVAALLAEEAAWHVRDYKRYQDFGARVGVLKADLVGLLTRLKGEGKTVAAYGASAKGATLLNTFGIGSQFLDYIVDRSTVKQGHFAPGTHLEILSPDVLARRKPDYLLLLAWNFADEILRQQNAYREAGGRFIIPIPTVAVV
ncbi:class I SAM-dependent methyltransferase [Limobrevibacterium gyesilva]|uniref:Class I SAM-dependent methyltransferase n=1 Tax=Limobrevibacterium gyesilva TaxID=2991712 RepID=A0AA42CGE5_9PROT|nr:class I SAM-dependent methyltransferase [Limobrevibacterium gyesilva]MCW3473927.1 class I SAM-dependent methyltransferase [Limobrevibacterium gyesilva]